MAETQQITVADAMKKANVPKHVEPRISEFLQKANVTWSLDNKGIYIIMPQDKQERQKVKDFLFEAGFSVDGAKEKVYLHEMPESDRQRYVYAENEMIVKQIFSKGDILELNRQIETNSKAIINFGEQIEKIDLGKIKTYNAQVVALLQFKNGLSEVSGMYGKLLEFSRNYTKSKQNEEKYKTDYAYAISNAVELLPGIPYKSVEKLTRVETRAIQDTLLKNNIKRANNLKLDLNHSANELIQRIGSTKRYVSELNSVIKRGPSVSEDEEVEVSKAVRTFIEIAEVVEKNIVHIIEIRAKIIPTAETYNDQCEEVYKHLK